MIITIIANKHFVYSLYKIWVSVSRLLARFHTSTCILCVAQESSKLLLTKRLRSISGRPTILVSNTYHYLFLKVKKMWQSTCSQHASHNKCTVCMDIKSHALIRHTAWHSRILLNGPRVNNSQLLSVQPANTKNTESCFDWSSSFLNYVLIRHWLLHQKLIGREPIETMSNQAGNMGSYRSLYKVIILIVSTKAPREQRSFCERLSYQQCPRQETIL